MCFNTAKIRRLSLLTPVYFLSLSIQAADVPAEHDIATKKSDIEQLTIIGNRLFQDTVVVSPTTNITAEDLAQVSFVTTEDAIAHAPSVIVRRRFIGDPNGVIGIRGSNMFQGTRSMVFADGMPLHYHLQTRFSGSPRWSLVSPSEVEQVNVIYGPFSAEYSGNAMGGVIDIKTKTPEKQRITIEGTFFSQEYDLLNTNERFNGGKVFVSYEDKIGDLTIFTSYNRLQNESQPQTQYRASSQESIDGETVSGGILGVDERGREVVYYGDSGPEEAQTELYKLKLGYDFGEIQLRGSLAYENRSREVKQHNNFLTDINSQVVWQGDANTEGHSFSVRNSNFQQRDQERDSLLLGIGISGLITNTDWVYDSFYSHFDILDDEEIRTGRNPEDPTFESANESFRGRLTEYDDTGWQIFDVKFGTDNLFNDSQQRLSVGLHLDRYELNIIADDYNAIAEQKDADELDGNLGTGRADSGGEAQTFAAFLQYGYALSTKWDLALGLRYDDWTTKNGYAGENLLAKRSEDGWSPKLSLGYFPSDSVSWRYSIARAIRFPIVEELYRNDSAVGGGSTFIADPNLNPEDGIFHNLSFNKVFQHSDISVNVFYDIVDDVIFNQSTSTDQGSITTSLPTEEVTTKGIEFSYSYKNIAESRLSLRYNLSYIDTEITKNTLNPDVIGNEFPRMPKWRSNLVASYMINTSVDANINLRYASNSYGRLDNLDTGHNVFGAQDEFLLLGTKVNWQVDNQTRLSVGIDNITSEEVYVFHPWPQRTFYLEGKYVFDGS